MHAPPAHARTADARLGRQSSRKVRKHLDSLIADQRLTLGMIDELLAHKGPYTLRVGLRNLAERVQMSIGNLEDVAADVTEGGRS